MCGIVGYLNTTGAGQRVVRGLTLLEYRGYDNYGVSVLTDHGFVTCKNVGSVSAADAAGAFADLPDAELALGHTRWATHGGVTVANAHPHLSTDGAVAVVHNGVIDNYQELRRALQSQGVVFASETDSEVVPHLLAAELADGHEPLEALERTVAQLRGEYALGVVFTRDPHTLYGARQKSPLAVACNGVEAMLASDQAPLLDLAEHVTYLEDGDVVRLRADEICIRHDGETVARPSVLRSGETSAPSKAGFEHWMLKEISEVPAVVDAALALPRAQLERAIPPDRHLTVIGAGSAFYVARIGQYFFTRLTGSPVHALPSDEALYWSNFGPQDAVIAVSQSGETFDTLEVCRSARAAGTWLTSLSNVEGSTQQRMADCALTQNAGAEICVLSTKSVISQVAILLRLAYVLANVRGAVDDAAYAAADARLRAAPVLLARVLTTLPPVLRELAARAAAHEHWFFIGRGPLYPVALESALKFKEVSYKHAEGLPSGFFKHGTISLIDEHFHTVALLPAADADHERLAATLANVSEIAARRGPVIGFGPADLSADARADFADYVPLPLTGDDGTDLLIHLLAGQLFAYYFARELGREIDQPRSLAKSVTVR